MMDRTRDGKPFRMLCIIDEFTRECLAIKVERKLNSRIVLEVLSELFLEHGPPAHYVLIMVLSSLQRLCGNGLEG